jgi:hypothetical protein
MFPFNNLKVRLLFLALMIVAPFQTTFAGIGDKTRLGQPGDWKDTIALTTYNDRLYSVEKNGALYETDLSNGKWRQLGKPDFVNTRHIFAVNESLYTIEADGTFYRVSPADGSWAKVGQAGAWKNTLAGTVWNGRIYTIEINGALYETNPGTGVWKQIGKAEFAGTRYLFSSGSSLYTIEDNGLYKVSTVDGRWSRVGTAEDWGGTRAAAVIGYRLYNCSKGAIYETKLTNGQWVTIGKTGFADTTILFESGLRLYAIDSDGSLYSIETPPLAG